MRYGNCRCVSPGEVRPVIDEATNEIKRAPIDDEAIRIVR
jgi:hypothetical protein